jgi:molybdenum cofactor cytidylyltransferase
VTTASPAGGVILAAGASRRMGEAKQLLPYRGRPLLEVVIAAACESALDEVVVVLGARAEEIAARAAFGRARVVINPAYEEGMSTSLRAGIDSLGSAIMRAVVILGDQPDIDAALINTLLDAQEASELPAAALSFDGLLHPPMVLSRSMWPALDAITGDVGLRAIIRSDPESVFAVPTQRRGAHPVDIDTREDFEQLKIDPA